MLALRPRSGYEIKQLRRQLHPLLLGGELRADLSGAEAARRGGAGRGRPTPQGGAPAHGLQAHREGPGARAARSGSQPPEVFEMRDEGLLKLFFAGAVEPARAAEIARERAEEAAEKRGRAARRSSATRRRGSKRPSALGYAVLRFGIEMNKWIAEWFERPPQDLEQSAAAKPARPEGGSLMFNALASLAQRRGKLVVVVAVVFFARRRRDRRLGRRPARPLRRRRSRHRERDRRGRSAGGRRLPGRRA